LPLLIEKSFKETFWNEEKKHLADCVNGSHKDWSLRPNQLFAVSLPFSPISDEIKKRVLETVKEKLLTKRGIRTLSCDDKNYRGIYTGTQRERDLAYHQGTVWPWLLGHFSEAYLKVNGKSGIPYIKNIYENFEAALLEYGIGGIAEIYDGNEPQKPKGAIYQAWSVAELLRIKKMLECEILTGRNII
jgi:glycogen debranching enzyme